MPNDEQLIKEMANLTMISGRINAMQEYNLKIYPLVFFNGVSSVKIDYDFSSNNKVEYEQNKSTLDTTFKIENKFTPKVEYFIELEEAQNDLLNKRFEHLEKSVRAIFWQDTKIMIYFNNKLVFESGKNVGK